MKKFRTAKFLALSLSLVMVLAAAGCGGGNNGGGSTTPPPASGGSSTPAPAPAERGQVLDFARCRQRLETREAWKELSRTAEAVSFSDEAPEEVPAAAAVRRERRERKRWAPE